MHMIGLDRPGKKVHLLGNEAIARGAIEARVNVATAYPGTPSTEIMETIASVAKEFGIYAEWSTNEKVAFEVAAGAAISGLRSMTSMKHAGLNWVSDPLSVVNLSGVNGGLLIVTADDPNCHSSANEQDNRFYGMFAEIPVLEPSDPQEAKDMTKASFELSEKIKLPIILRSVTRVSHVRGDVILGEISKSKREAISEIEPQRFWISAQFALRHHIQRHKNWGNVEKIVEDLPFNKLEMKGDERLCVITSGSAHNYVKEALCKLNARKNVAVLKIGTVYPIPKTLVKKALKVETVLIVEEGEPFLELQVRALTADLEFHSKVLGKTSGTIPIGGELTTEPVLEALSRLLNRTYVREKRKNEEYTRIILPRTLTFCPACPHSATLYALKKTLRRIKKQGTVICGDIGCYALSVLPPYELGNVKYSMGASIAVAAGLSRVLKEKIIALIGDSTFFHAGIPALINGVYNNYDFVIIVLDNMVTGMTGGQPHPGVGITATGNKTKRLLIENVAKACGVDFVKVIDSYDVEKLSETIEKAMKFDGLALIVSRRLCALEARRGKSMTPFYVDLKNCINCGICMSQFVCPAISKYKDEVVIDESLCIGCGVCAKVCPKGAILPIDRS